MTTASSPMFDELHVRTQYDGRDLMSVEEIYHHDQDGNEIVLKGATEACIDIGTCADQGYDLWSWLRLQVEGRLKGIGVTYESLVFDDQL